MADSTMDPQTLTAIQMLGQYTRGRFDIYALAGSGNSAARANVMRMLTGEKVPIAKCGVHALTDAFYARMNITGSCIAHREDAFVDACKAVEQEAADHRSAAVVAGED